jgi:hypothetical protein
MIPPITKIKPITGAAIGTRNAIAMITTIPKTPFQTIEDDVDGWF